MTTFKEGDKVALIINGALHGKGIVERVGATCLYCWTDGQTSNPFHSHIENFVSLEPQKTDFGNGIFQVFTNTPEGPGYFRMHYEDSEGNVIEDPYDKTRKDCMDKFNNVTHFDEFPEVETRRIEASDIGKKPLLIGIAGRKGMGKDTAAQGLPNFENVKFAAPLKEMTRVFLRYVGVSEESIDRCVDGDMKETPLACFGGRSTRFFMQKLGTEFGREMIWDDLWTNAFAQRSEQFEKVVCTDVRFENEVELIKRMGGRTVRVTDPRKALPDDAHISETAINSLPVDVEVVNDGSIWELHEKMRWTFDPFAPMSVVK